jgi:DNA-directed RNA polymerase specialized sigma24 family protein
MTGSIADGEDVVQDTLARAYYELSELRELPALRSWLFRIAHTRAKARARVRSVARVRRPGELQDVPYSSRLQVGKVGPARTVKETRPTPDTSPAPGRAAFLSHQRVVGKHIGTHF